MAFKAPVGKSSDYELPKPGMVYARCFGVVDLGTHLDPKFPLNEKGDANWRHLVRLYFELDQTMVFNGEKVPMITTYQATLSAHEKANLRKFMEQWWGQKFDSKKLDKAGGFDMEKVIGKPALLNIQHSSDGKYANIGGINPPVAGYEVAPQHYPTRLFMLSAPSADVWAQLSQNTRKKIAESREVKEGGVKLPALSPSSVAAPAAESVAEATSDEDAPF